MKNEKIALVLGATGGVGGETAKALLKNGWTVKALVRKANPENLDNKIVCVVGDAMNAEDVEKAARGVSLIVHAVNPPGYKNWGQVVIPMVQNTIRAAKIAGARIVLPGTIYNYGVDTDPLLSEVTIQKPTTRKGAIRVQMEKELFEASKSGVRVLILRCGDFFGPLSGNNWFSQGLVKPGQPLKSISYPGDKGVGHGWAYLPDVAQTIAKLVDQEDRLSNFEVFHFSGHWDSDGSQMINAVIKEAQQPQFSVQKTPWLLIKVLSPFIPIFREMSEMHYLWKKPFQLNNQRLIKFLKEEPHTPLNEAVKQSLLGLGCVQ